MIKKFRISLNDLNEKNVNFWLFSNCLSVDKEFRIGDLIKGENNG
jgi:hypothetical protein